MESPTQRWQKSAIEDLENTDLSIAEIATKYGRSVHTIKKLRRLYNVTRKLPAKRMGPRKTADLVSLSPEHRALGSRMTAFRGSRTYTDLAAEIGVSRHVTKLMEMGVHDFTLSQLMQISKLMNRPVDELLKPIHLSEKKTLPHDRYR